MKVVLTVDAKKQLMAAAQSSHRWDAVNLLGSYLRALSDKRNGKFELVRYTRAGLVRYVRKDEKGEHFVFKPSQEITASYYRQGDFYDIELVFYDFDI
jgi:hypothetical protein